MKFQNNVQMRIDALKLQIEALKIQEKMAREEFIYAKMKEGWQKFTFLSRYSGHREGFQDEEIVYLFHPSIDLSRWDGVSFSHNPRSDDEDENNVAFENWLKELSRDHFIEMD